MADVAAENRPGLRVIPRDSRNDNEENIPDLPVRAVWPSGRRRTARYRNYGCAFIASGTRF